MATIYADIQGIKWLREAVGAPGFSVAEVAFTLGIYEDSVDNGQIGGTGTKRNGVDVATGTTFEQILAADRRDGKTVTLSAITTGVALTAEPGLQGSTLFYISTPAVSSNNMTFNVCNVSGTELDAPAGILDRPIVILVRCALS